jgi:ABC-type uncharacterized transport system substrate-binding protein
MKRREFLGLVAGGVAWPVVARAQQQTTPMIGFLSSRSPEDSKPHLAGFLRGLEAFGYTDGKTVKIEYRWAYGRYEQLRKLASELAALQPVIVVAAGGAPSARAAKSVTASIPITFVTSDSVSEGVVASLNQPGANITGVDLMSGELTGKRLELLSRLLPTKFELALNLTTAKKLGLTIPPTVLAIADELIDLAWRHLPKTASNVRFWDKADIGQTCRFVR